MKRTHVEDEDGHKPEHDTTDDNNFTNSNPEITNTTPILPNFLNHPSFLSPPPHLLSPRQYPILLQQPQYSQNTPTFTVPTTTGSTEDGGKIVKSRRTGRPPGAKNKPKPQIIINPEPESKPAMSSYLLELPSGSDLVDSLTRFTRNHGIGICVLSATGTVSDVTLKQPTGNGTYGTVTFHGNFDIFTLSACVMTDTTPFGVSMAGGTGFTIAMTGPNGLVVGGKVVGPLVCAGTVYVVATSFNSPSYVRLPLEDKNQSNRVTGGNGSRSRLPVSEGSGTHVSLHGGDSEVLCAPTPLTVRSPQPPY
ncbi:AT-hook motif nuclear-localized protein 28-like [Silene latifolia]|uniref:AT-hook motif nuclear-localized protein 28-like n=1 Tax=Silene latifolia TaxID=37657 RepID=UPI003D773495